MKKYLLSIAVLMAATISFTSCDDDDDSATCPTPVIPRYGVYVINEGNYSYQINGTLDFLGYDVAKGTYSMTDSIFEKVNGRSLGGTPNDALIFSDSLLCIAVADEDRVEFVNTTTKKASAAVSIDSPRELAYESGSNYLYVSSYTGKVYKIDMTTRTIAGESEKVGANLEGIAVAGNKLYVCNSCNPDYTYNKNVVELNANTLAKNQDIEVVDNPVDVINAGSAIFILSMGNYADKPATVQMLKDGQLSTIGNATMMAYDAYNDQLYMINAPFGGDKEYKVYNLKNGQTTTFLTNPDIFSPYSLAVNPVNGDVFITSSTKNPDTGYADYTADCKLYRYTSAGILLGTYDCGVNPGTIVCDSYYQK
jgi:hypothetical protein